MTANDMGREKAVQAIVGWAAEMDPYWGLPSPSAYYQAALRELDDDALREHWRAKKKTAETWRVLAMLERP